MDSSSLSLSSEICVALYNYTANNSNELTFKKGDKIRVLKREGEWLEGELNGSRGWFPMSFVELLNPDLQSKKTTPNTNEGVELTAIPQTQIKSTLTTFLAQRGTNKKEFKKKLREKNILVKDKNKEKKQLKNSTQQNVKNQENMYFYSRRPTSENEKSTTSSQSTTSLPSTTQRKPVLPIPLSLHRASVSSSPSPSSSSSSSTPKMSLSPSLSSRKTNNELEMLRQMQSQKEAKAEKEKKKNFLSNFLAKRLMRQKSKTSSESKPEMMGICGLSLEEMIQRQTQQTTIPLCIKLCVDFIAQHGLETEGIFRLAGNVLKVEELSRLFFASDLATVGGITPSTDIHVVAELLKKILRELPEPIFTYKFHDEFVKLTNDTSQQRATKFRELFEQLPQLNREVLKYLFPLLRDIAKHSDKNLMTAQNIATIFGPTLLRPKEFDFLKGLNDRSFDVVYIMIKDYDLIFVSSTHTRRESSSSGSKTNSSGPPSPRTALAMSLRITSPRSGGGGGGSQTKSSTSQSAVSPRKMNPPLSPTSLQSFPPPPPPISTSSASNSISQSNENTGQFNNSTTMKTTTEPTSSENTTSTNTQ